MSVGRSVVRWVLSVSLVAAGLSVTWAWGRVAQLAEPVLETGALSGAVYAAWQPAGTNRALFFRSLNGGATWQPLRLPAEAGVTAWAGDGALRVAVALDDGSLLRSKDRGDTWSILPRQIRVLSLAWGASGQLYLGTADRGVLRLGDTGGPATLEPQGALAQAAVHHLAAVDGRVFAATADGLFYSDDGGESWACELVPGRISALAALDRNTLFVALGARGVFKSTDAGRSWQPALTGLGATAGQYPEITALRIDPQEPGVLYAAVGWLVGGTELHFSAAGTFASLDGGASWLPLAGPTFPEARKAAGLVVSPAKPLQVQAVTAGGLQRYQPDLAGAMASLESPQNATPLELSNAVRLVGLARSEAAGAILLRLLAEGDPATSLLAAEALGRIADPATAGVLLAALDDSSARVCLSAVRALGAMRYEAAVEPLGRMLMEGDSAAVSVAAGALARIGTPAATEALLAALSDPALTPRRHAALGGVEQIGEAAVLPLVGLLGGEDPVAARNAAEALGWVGSAAATPALMEALTDGTAAVRLQAAWALGEIGDPGARSVLRRAERRDADGLVREAAAAALSRLAPQGAAVSGWTATWAAALARFQPARWLVLALSLAGAAWLVLSRRKLVPMLSTSRRS